jgi:demethylmenaquinone methyltransferase/2-methoxy-6-polyprenyl-1,4-benzoquinol methylase
MSIDRRWRKEGIRKLKIGDGELVLDIATGTGDLALQAMQGNECTMVGIDLARNMLLEARRKCDSLSLVQGDGLRMPFPDNTFGRAMIGYGIRNVVDVDGFLREVHRVLRKGGRFCILELSIPRNRVIRWGYMLYLKRILPRIGGFRSGDLAAYEYLRDSVLDFPRPDALIEMIEASGFNMVEDRAQMFNVSHLYLMEKV